jgi:hypothetical protein
MSIQRWIPLEEIPEKLFLEGLHDDYEGFRLLLKGSGNSKTLRISFEFVLGYRNFNESERLKTLNSIPELGKNWSLFIIKNSAFINWLIDESYNKYSEEELNHFVIATPDDVVEVISLNEPQVEWLN